MTHKVKIKGVGTASFPDNMGLSEIREFLKKKYPNKQSMAHESRQDNRSPSDAAKKVTKYMSDVFTGDVAYEGLKEVGRTIDNSPNNPQGLLDLFGAGTIAKKTSKILSTVSKNTGLSRMDRAKEMGFMTDMPLYHGTNKDFDSFKLFEGEDLTRSVSRSPVGKLGISLAIEPRLANEFASRAGGEGMNVIPALHRAERPVSLELDGSESNEDIFVTIVDAWNRGFDAIKFNNYTTKEGGPGQSFILVKDPNQVRSVNANFDPKKKLSPELLAGVAGASIIPGLIQDTESEQLNLEQ